MENLLEVMITLAFLAIILTGVGLVGSVAIWIFEKIAIRVVAFFEKKENEKKEKIK